MNSTTQAEPLDRLLDCTEQLIYQGGICATGMDAIVKASGVSRKTLYKHFGTKDQLVTAALKRRDERWMAWFEGGLERFDGPRAQLLGAFEVLQGWFASDDFNGCAFINTAGEVSSPDDPVRQVAKLHKEKLRHCLRLRCQTLGAFDPDALASQLLLLIDGAITNALVSNRASVAVDAQRAAAALLASQGL
ncbi:TetR/AcrR family transcriptional regulator [Gallaecimonas kandeliae]|uniref:TetR/AcrR family transcriptional regulator n=1 Tax=Gallaecimonas kandeliae TaxID=3029055 RepID=UPI00264871B9|nr:TetR/AcrR family transcriptional regulator [Gallaecimonas kandeliae]WKE64115.1 TetR/AcrR family transcriptional regulator [Gallaecimonas kandeliae]